MKKILALIIVLLTPFLFSQQNGIGFEFDYSMFRFDSSSNYLEIYYSFSQSSLAVHNADSKQCVEAILHIEIQDTASKQVFVNKDWKIKNEIIDSSEENKNKLLIGVIGFNLPKGFYKCYIGGVDLTNQNRKKYYTEYFRVIPFKTNLISISDIQFASKIIQDSQSSESIFYKNKLEVIPIPNSVFGESQPALFYYSEIYNLLKDSKDKILKLNTIVYDSKGKLFYNKIKSLVGNVDSRVEVGAINVHKFPTESYTLHLILFDSTTNFKVSSAKKFFVYNPSIIDTLTNTGTKSEVLSSQFGIMSIEECDNLFSKSKYISTSQEIQQYGKLSTLEGKREFLFNFWKARDTEISTQRNEYLSEYLQRINYVNQKYSTFKKEGWKTDRGRIYLMHGEPSEIERFPNQVDTKPYEIWHYNQIEGGVIFIFADITGFSEYTLVHSTLRGELRDDQWLRRIVTN